MKSPLFVLCLTCLLAVPATFAQSTLPRGYEVNADWAQLPQGMTWNASTSNVVADREGHILVLVRAAPFFRFFNRDGSFIRAWGEADLFNEPHSAIFDADGNIWTTDSRDHLVRKFTPDGQLLLSIGKRGIAGDNDSTDSFNRPNAIALAPNGDIYVCDGYENARIVQFNNKGELVRIIGGMQGAEPGELDLPHGVVLDSSGRILVNDSDNQRISVFGADGRFIETWAVPSRGNIIVTADDTVYVSDVNAGSVSILRNGNVVDRIENLGRPHGLSMDSDGTLYASDSMNRVIMKITPRP